MARTLPPRSEIPVQHTWDAASVYASDEAWEADFSRVEGELHGLESFKGRLGEAPTVLADWLETFTEVMKRVGRVYIYANLLYAVDTANGEEKAKSDRARSLVARAAAASSFAEPEILAIGPDTLKSWLGEEPRLAQYEHYFDRLERRRAHVRSAEVEELLGLVSEPFGTATATHGILVDTDLRFTAARGQDGEEVEPAQGNIDALLSDPDREIRRTAWESYSDAHLGVKNTVANVLSAGVKQHVFVARARRYDSALQAALEPSFIPVEVFHSLIETFKRNLPTWHRYWRIRRQALGFDTLHVYDIKAPLTSASPTISYEQAVDWIVQGMSPLGDEYTETLRRGSTSERWVDIYPNQHKRSGAYSTGWYGTHPFILMSYKDDIFSMSTLAHELGHSMHSYFTRKTQPFVYAQYGLFVAEVASNFNQAMVRAHLLGSSTDRDFKITVIEEAMSNFHRYFFIMPTLARFELEIHQRVERGEALTADGMIALLSDLFVEGYGGEVDLDVDRIGITWAEFPNHMYANFYVFQYATGISAAHALSEAILERGGEAAERYLAFLKAGGSLYPLDALELAGVDMTSSEPVERTFSVLSRMVDQLEELVAEASPAGV